MIIYEYGLYSFVKLHWNAPRQECSSSRLGRNIINVKGKPSTQNLTSTPTITLTPKPKLQKF